MKINFKGILVSWLYVIIMQVLAYFTILAFQFIKEFISEILVLIEMGKEGIIKDATSNSYVYRTFKRKVEWTIALIIIEFRDQVRKEYMKKV